METFVVIVECAIEHEGKFLIIRRPEGVHAGGLLAFPGGKVDYQDGRYKNHDDYSDSNLEQVTIDILSQAVKREIMEETGLYLIDPLHFVRSSYFVDKYGHNVLATLYHCKIENTVLNLQVSLREVPEYFWLTPTQINEHAKSPIWLKVNIKDVLDRQLIASCPKSMTKESLSNVQT